MALSVGEIEATLRLRDQMTGELARATQQLNSFGASATAVGRTLSIGLTAPIVAAGAAAFKFSSDFETTMTRVGVITDIGIDNIGEMGAAVIALAPTVGIGPTPLAEALLVVASTGLEGAAALDVLEASAKASAVGLGETKDIARATTAAITAYGAENLSAAEATNKLFVAVRAGGAEATEFAASLGRVIGIASQVGVSFDEVLASIATFTRLGISAEEATTALRGTLSTLLKPTEEAKDQLLLLGTSIEELRASVQDEGLAAALTELVTLTQGNDDAIAAIVPNVRALAGVMGTAGAQAEAYAQVLADVQGATTDLDDAFTVVSDTLGFKWNAAWAQAQTVLIQFGDAIAPALEQVFDGLSALLELSRPVLDWFSSLPEPVRNATVAIAGLAAAIGPLLLALGTLSSVLGVVATGLGLVTTVAATLASPFVVGGLAIAALTGYVVSEILEVNKNSKALDDMTAAMLSANTATETLSGKVFTLGETIKSQAEGTREMIVAQAAWNSLTAEGKKAAEEAGRIIQEVLNTSLDENKKSLDESAKSVALTAEQLEAMAEAQEFVTKAINDFNVEAGKALGINAALFTSFESLTAMYERISKAEVQARIESVALWDAVQAGAESAIGPTEEMVRQIEAFATISQGATGIWEQFSFSVADQLKVGGEEGGESFWDGFSGVLESALRSVPRLIEDALTGGADLARAAQAIAVEFASAFMSELGSALSGGSQLVASAFAAIGGAGAVLVSALFGSLIETDFEKVGKELAERFGQSFSEELQRQVEQSFKEVGNRAAAVLANLGDIVAELGGVTAANFALIVGQADELVLQYARRTLDLETVTRELLVVYPQLAAEFENAGAAGQQAFVDLTTRALTFGTIDLPTVIQAIEDIGQSFVDLDAAGQQAFLDLILAAQAFGATTEDLIKAVADPFASVLGPALAMIAENSELASQELLNVIAAAQQLGVATAEIAKFLEQMQALGLAGLQGLLENIFLGEDVAALADVFLDTFQTLLDAGLSFDEALKALGPGLDNLILKMQEAGLEGTEAFQRITDLANQAGNEIINTAVAAAQAAVNVLVSLNNQALLDQKTFSVLAQTIVQAFDALQNEGVAGEDALRRLQPELQKLWELQQDFNFIVDEGTQALLDQAVAAGFVGDQFRSESSQMLDAMQGVFLILLAIAEALGATIPDSLTKMANEMRFAASGGVESMSDLEIAIGDVATTAEQVGETVHQELSQAAKDSSEAMARAMDEISREAEKTGKTIEDEITNGANAAAVAMGDAAARMIKDLQDVQRQAEETGGASPTGVEMITFRIHEAMDAMGRAAGQMVADLSRVGAAAAGIGLSTLATSVGVQASGRPSMTPAFTSISLPETSSASTVLQPIVLQVDGQVLTRVMVRIAPRVLSTLGI